jgi:hypothetical protein
VQAIYCRRQNSIIPRTAAKSQKILPPNSRNAAAAGHLAKDSACGENSLARSKNPNRSRIPKAVTIPTTALDQIFFDRFKADSGTRQGINSSDG